MSEPSNQNKSTIKLLYPLLFAAMLAVGIGIGWQLHPTSSGKVSVFSRTQYNQLDEILNYIDNRYVDTVNTDKLFSVAVDEMFKKLDPHSLYISSEELARLNEPLRGQFEGIGVEFFIVEDTITVVSTLPGGPSEKVGLQAGDKIVEIEDSIVAGTNITNQDVISKLKGPKGSKVQVTVKRSTQPDDLEFVITRDAVKLSSVDAAYLLQPGIGYIKMSKFAATTHAEMVDAIKRLEEKGMEKLVLDLRDNGGGYLDQATKIADEFLEGNKKIVYTEGRMYPEKVYRAGKPGVYEEGELVVMINENSASASEILAGALQDWGRATIIGRRSFGKALVQEEILLNDGSAMRLTVARYFTPKGRSIQRSYEEGIEAYNEEHWNRMLSEYEESDSFAVHDTAQYGIQPDIYVPWDTTYVYRELISLINRGYVPRFTYQYFSNHQGEFEQYEDVQSFLNRYTVSDNLVNAFINKAERRAEEDGITYAWDSLTTSKEQVKQVLKAYFGRQLFYYDAFYPVMNEMDKELQQAIQLLQS